MGMLQDPFFWAFIATALILGWVVSGHTGRLKGLRLVIAQLDLERDAQASTIDWQRKVIAELEKGKAELEIFEILPQLQSPKKAQTKKMKKDNQ